MPLSRVRRWIAHREKLPAPIDPPTPLEVETEVVTRKKKGRGTSGVPLRSWSQADLDAAISKYKAERASTFTDLAAGVRACRPGAKKTAQNTYGRNAIARALGVRAPAMVSKSPEWQRIADELGLRKQKAVAGKSHKQRIGIDIALEEQAQATGSTAIDAAVRRETIDIVNRAMPAAEAEATVEKLQRGEISDDSAR